MKRMHRLLPAIALAGILFGAPLPALAGDARVHWKPVAVDAACDAGQGEVSISVGEAHLLRSAADVHAVAGDACTAHVPWKTAALIRLTVPTRTSVRVTRVTRKGKTLRVRVRHAEFCSGVNRPEEVQVLWIRVPRGATRVVLDEGYEPSSPECRNRP